MDLQQICEAVQFTGWKNKPGNWKYVAILAEET